MNPPLRGREDREALIEGIKDGTIDIIATDHAPHSKEEKAKGLKDSAFGIVGLETAFPAAVDPLGGKRNNNGRKADGADGDEPEKAVRESPLGNDFSIWSMEETVIEPDKFVSMGRATPFEGAKVRGKCMLTVCDGKIVYK